MEVVLPSDWWLFMTPPLVEMSGQRGSCHLRRDMEQRISPHWCAPLLVPLPPPLITRIRAWGWWGQGDDVNSDVRDANINPTLSRRLMFDVHGVRVGGQGWWLRKRWRRSGRHGDCPVRKRRRSREHRWYTTSRSGKAGDRMRGLGLFEECHILCGCHNGYTFPTILSVADIDVGPLSNKTHMLLSALKSPTKGTKRSKSVDHVQRYYMATRDHTTNFIS